MVTGVMLLQIFATPVMAIERIIEEDIKENSQLEEVTNENVEETNPIINEEEVAEPMKNREPDLLNGTGNIVKDEQFAYIVRWQLGLEDDHEITIEDMQNLTYIYLDGVYDYSGLEYAINLESIDIEGEYYGNTVFDMSIFRTLTKLKFINLTYMHGVTNVQIVNNMPALKYFEIMFNYEEDLLNSMQELLKIDRRQDLYLELSLYEDGENTRSCC